MTEGLPDLNRDGRLLSEALRSVRRYRGLSVSQTASAMNLSIRTYQRFEAGETRLNLDHLNRFATATNSDPHAFLLAVTIGSPSFAVRCADNKLGTIFTIALQKLDETLAGRLTELDTRSLVSAATALIDRLSDQVLATDPSATWLEQGQADLAAKRPRPGR